MLSRQPARVTLRARKHAQTREHMADALHVQEVVAQKVRRLVEELLEVGGLGTCGDGIAEMSCGPGVRRPAIVL